MIELQNQYTMVNCASPQAALPGRTTKAIRTYCIIWKLQYKYALNSCLIAHKRAHSLHFFTFRCNMMTVLLLATHLLLTTFVQGEEPHPLQVHNISKVCATMDRGCVLV